MFGPTDLRAKPGAPAELQGPVAMLLGGPPADNPQAADSPSPILHVDPTDPPLLIIHGTKDPLVAYEESVNLAAALRKEGVPVPSRPSRAAATAISARHCPKFSGG